MAKRILTLCLALVIGIAFAMPAAAAVKSIKVGGDITIRGIYRQNLDFVKDRMFGIEDDSATWLMSTTRIWIKPELTDNISAVVRLLNERDWDVEDANSNDVNLDIAYIKMQDLFIPGFSATIGRQEILLGKGFVVGNVNGTTGSAVGTIRATELTARKSFDAVRLDYEIGTTPVTITVFDAKISETAPGNGDCDLSGLNVGYNMDNLKIEGYALLLDSQTEEAIHLYTFGARVDGNIPAVLGLNFNAEAALQIGKDLLVTAPLRNEDQAGWAGNADVSYTFQSPMELKVGGAWYYASGDHYDHSEDWVPLYPDNTSDRIGRIFYACDRSATNMSVPKVYVSFKPSEKNTLSLALFPVSTIDSIHYGVRNPDGTITKASNEIGSEIDFGYTYQYTEDLSFGVNVDIARAGKAIKQNVGGSDRFDSDAWQAIGTVAIAF